jgi:hypothetical protein
MLREHLPFQCAAAWAAAIALAALPLRCENARFFAAVFLAQCGLGILRLPWRHPWDSLSYWIDLGVFPLLAVGARIFLAALIGPERAVPALASLLAVWFFPVKLAFRLAGLELPPTPAASPVVLVLLAGGAPILLKAWRAHGRKGSPGSGPAPGAGR